MKKNVVDCICCPLKDHIMWLGKGFGHSCGGRVCLCYGNTVKIHKNMSVLLLKKLPSLGEGLCRPMGCAPLGRNKK